MTASPAAGWAISHNPVNIPIAQIARIICFIVVAS
jgi:hypothetical protein